MRPELGLFHCSRAARLPKLPPGLLGEVPPPSGSFPGGSPVIFGRPLSPGAIARVVGAWRPVQSQMGKLKRGAAGWVGDLAPAGGARGTRGRPPAGAAVVWWLRPRRGGVRPAAGGPAALSGGEDRGPTCLVTACG